MQVSNGGRAATALRRRSRPSEHSNNPLSGAQPTLHTLLPLPPIDLDLPSPPSHPACSSPPAQRRRRIVSPMSFVKLSIFGTSFEVRIRAILAQHDYFPRLVPPLPTATATHNDAPLAPCVIAIGVSPPVSPSGYFDPFEIVFLTARLRFARSQRAMSTSSPSAWVSPLLPLPIPSS